MKIKSKKKFYLLFIDKTDFNEVIIKIFKKLLQNQETKVVTKNFENYLNQRRKKIFALFNFQKEIIAKHNLRKIKYPINFHPGTRQFPGRGCYSWAIYKNVKSYGSTAHMMESKVDSGKIISEDKFEIDKRETIETLKFKTFISSLKLFFEILLKFLRSEKITFKKVKWKKKPYKIRDLDKISEIKKKMTKNEKDKIFRSTVYYPHGPFIIKKGKKIKFKLNKKINII